MSLYELDRNLRQDTPSSPRAAAPIKGGFSREDYESMKQARSSVWNNTIHLVLLVLLAGGLRLGASGDAARLEDGEPLQVGV